jgi:amidase
MTGHKLSAVDDAISHKLEDLARFLTRQGAVVSLKAAPDFDLAQGHRLFIEMLRATTSARTDAAAMARWQDEAKRAGPDDHSYYAMMARGVSMTHRDFLLANEQRQRMRRAWARFFEDWDVFLCLVAASAAPPHDQKGERWERTLTVNAAQVPVTDQMFWAGISGFYLLPGTAAPLGFTAENLPFGVQIVGRQYGDRQTIALARALETTW